MASESHPHSTGPPNFPSSVSFYEYVHIIPSIEQERAAREAARAQAGHPGVRLARSLGDLRSLRRKKSSALEKTEAAQAWNAIPLPVPRNATVPAKKGVRLGSKTYTVPLPSFLAAGTSIPAEFHHDPRYASHLIAPRINVKLPTLAIRRKRAVPAVDPSDLKTCLKEEGKGDNQARKSRKRSEGMHEFGAVDVPDPVYSPVAKMMSAFQQDSDRSHDPSIDLSSSQGTGTSGRYRGELADLPAGIVHLSRCCTACEDATAYGISADYIVQWSAMALDKRARDEEALRELNDHGDSEQGSGYREADEDSAVLSSISPGEASAEGAQSRARLTEFTRIDHIDELESARKRLSHISIDLERTADASYEDEEEEELLNTSETDLATPGWRKDGSFGRSMSKQPSVSSLSSSTVAPSLRDALNSEPCSVRGGKNSKGRLYRGHSRTASTSSQSSLSSFFNTPGALSREIFEVLQDQDTATSPRREKKRDIKKKEKQEGRKRSNSWTSVLKSPFWGPGSTEDLIKTGLAPF